MQKTLYAIILNIVLPGTGYLYIGAKSRKRLAILLVAVTGSGIIYTINNFMSGNYAAYQINLSPFFPGLDISIFSVAIVTAISVDTYFQARQYAVPSKPMSAEQRFIRKASIALSLNILLPGLGYIYLKATNRIWIAIPLMAVALYDIGYIAFVLFTHSHYPYAQNLAHFGSSGLTNVMVYSWLTYIIIGIDTWVVASRLYQTSLHGQPRQTEHA